MLNILEGYDIGALGFGSADTLHLLAEVLKIAFADRAAATADPAFVKVPVAEAAVESPMPPSAGRGIDLGRAQTLERRGRAGRSARNTTHLTVADGTGNIVASTQTINSLFGARYIVPGHRHDPEQLHVRVRPASGPRQFGGSRQARHLVDVAGDRAAGRQAASMHWACPAACASSPR